MNGKILLDANIVIAVFEQERSVLDRLTSTEQLFVSSVAIATRDNHFSEVEEILVERW